MRNPFRRSSAEVHTKGVVFDESLAGPGVSGFTQLPFTALDQAFGPLGSYPGLGASQSMPSQVNALLYINHPGARAVIDTLARNVAQLPLKAFQDSAPERQELTRSNRLTDALRRPDPTMPAADWKFAVVVDLLVHGESIHVLVNDRILVRLDPTVTEVQGPGSQITGYAFGGETYDPADVLHIKFFNPLNPKRGLSPITSLRSLLAEDLAASRYRLATWSGANPGRWVYRPVEAPELGNKGRERFEAYLKERMQRGDTIPMLEEGMELRDVGVAAHGGEYVASRTFVLQMICAVLGVPGNNAGVTDRNADAAHRALYQDAVAPLTAIIEDAINTQLVPRLLGPTQTAGGRIFVEFTLEEKLRGSFREQTEAFATATGGPWMTPNETRALQNMQPVAGGDVLYPPRPASGGGGGA